MSSQELPPELAALEQELAGRARKEVPPDLRQRVLTAMTEELRPVRSLWGWSFATAAAAVLLWINFSMSVTSNVSLPHAADPPDGRIEETTRRIRALAPELPENEVHRQALLARAGPRLVPAPSSSPDRVRRKERHLWVTP
jgi:hypothetical protein